MSNTFEVTIGRTLPAPVEIVFEAWLDPKALAKFIKPMEGMSDCRVEVDARVGGKFLLVMMAGDKELPHRGEYKTIERYERLVFTWQSEHTLPGSIVTLTFAAIGANETELTLHHVGLSDEETRANHEKGWREIIQQLTRLVTSAT